MPLKKKTVRWKTTTAKKVAPKRKTKAKKKSGWPPVQPNFLAAAKSLEAAAKSLRQKAGGKTAKVVKKVTAIKKTAPK